MTTETPTCPWCGGDVRENGSCRNCPAWGVTPLEDLECDHDECNETPYYSLMVARIDDLGQLQKWVCRDHERELQQSPDVRVNERTPVKMVEDRNDVPEGMTPTEYESWVQDRVDEAKQGLSAV